MRSRVSKKLVLLGLAIAFTFALASGADAQPGEFVKGVLQPLADGFPKRALTLVNVDDAASRDGIYIRELQAMLKGISPVDIIISDEPSPSYGNWYTVKDVSTREGGLDGYFPILWSYFGGPSDLLVEPIEKELKVKLSDVSAVIVLENLVDIIYQRKKAPWGPTFAGLVKYGKANPGKLRYVCTEIGSGGDIRGEWLINYLGLKVAKMPAGGHQQVASVIGAGEGDFTLGLVDTARTNWEAGKIDVIMLMGDSLFPPWDKDPNIVSSKQAGIPKNHLVGSTGFAVPTGVPREHIEWLYKLFKATATTEGYKKRLALYPAIKLPLLNPKEGDALNKSNYDQCEPIIRAIGLHWDQQKK